MNSSKKSTSTILKIIKPKKRRAVFFVLLAIFVLGFSFSFYTPHAFAWVPTQTERDAMKKEWDATDAQIDQALKDHPKTAEKIALQTYLPGYKQAQLDAADTDATGLRTSDPDVGATSALKGLGFFLSETVLIVVIGVLGVFVSFAKYLVVFSAQVLDLTLSPALYSFTSNNMIVQGWTVVRDVCNLFFLLVLLFIAICTILKIEKYHAKKTLLTLIIMALLINFSKPITIFIFDGSQLLMNFFLDQIGKTGTGDASGGASGSALITKASEISDFIYKSLPGYWESPDTSVNLAIQYIFAAVFLFMLAVAYLVTALMMIIRIVAIMMLIIVSPFAFFAAIIPDLSKMSSKWWSSLFEYSYYGPAAAFFLLLATKLENVLPNLKNTVGTTAYSAKDMTTTIYNITHYLTVLVFLYASIFMAKQFGGGAGAAIVGNANRVMKWAGGMSKGGGMWGSGARLAGGVTGVSNMYRGAKEGVSQQPFWRMLTKKGREASSKESQEKWEERVAPFSMATARKKAKEGEFKDQAKVDAGIARGNTEDLLIGSKRGTLTPEQLENSKVQQLIASSPELRKEVLGNLRDKGQSHTAAYLRSLTPEPEDIKKEKTLETFGKEEIFNNKKLGDMDWEKVIAFKHEGKQPFEQILVDRLGVIAETNAQGFLNIASNLDGTKQGILKDNPKFQDVLKSARGNAQKRNTGSQSNTGSQTGGYQSSGYGP